MKFLVALFILSTTHQALAAGFECVGRSSGFQGRILAITSLNGRPATLTIEMNGRVVYKAVPVVSEYRTSLLFQSPSFVNKNGAPAGLFVQVYELDGKIYGEFSETSYLPVVPSFDGECRRI